MIEAGMIVSPIAVDGSVPPHAWPTELTLSRACTSRLAFLAARDTGQVEEVDHAQLASLLPWM